MRSRMRSVSSRTSTFSRADGGCCRVSPVGRRSTDAVARRERPRMCGGAYEYDLYYIDNWCIWFDIEIMVWDFVTIARGAH